jgi:NAD(P)-dependent dehydrogenase (short-subunit alcohol dehydrogenase family)
MKAQFDLTGKVALITGSSKGIGASIAKSLAANGAQVIVSSRSQEAIELVANEIIDSGGKAYAQACNVGEEVQLRALTQFAQDTCGGVDILINNAATNPVFGQLSENTTEVFDKIMNVNVRAAFTLSNLCLPMMKERGGGSVINIASVEGLKPSFGLGLYSVSKAALIMLTKSQAKEWGRSGIRSNAICPGLIQTKFSKAIWANEDMLKAFTKQLPLQRMAQPDEISGLALFLASSASSYVTGTCYTADGGYMLA